MVITIDIDDVLCDLNARLQPWHNERYGTRISASDVTTYHLDQVWGCDRQESYRRVQEFFEEEGRSLAVLPGAQASVAALAAKHPLIALTSRFPYMEIATIEWISEHFPGKFVDVYFSSHMIGGNGNLSKAQYAKQIGSLVHLEDSLEYAVDVAQQGIPVVLFDNPWNRVSIEGHDSSRIQRVQGWPGAMRHLGEDNWLAKPAHHLYQPLRR